MLLTVKLYSNLYSSPAHGWQCVTFITQRVMSVAQRMKCIVRGWNHDSNGNVHSSVGASVVNNSCISSSLKR
jgi:hypothetical protein